MALYIGHSIFHLARPFMSGRKILDPTMYVFGFITLLEIGIYPERTVVEGLYCNHLCFH